MTILEMLNDKINDLKQNSQEELKRINNILNIINDTIEAIDDEIKFKDYDFSIAINLVNSNSFGILDLEKSITDIKNILVAKYDYHQTFLTLSDEQKQAIKSFKERLGFLKEELEKRIEEQSKIEVDEDTLENLEDLKNLLIGKGRRKYYTYEMIEALFEVIDYDKFTSKDMDELIKELSISKNIKGQIEEDKKDLDEVISLYQEYLGKLVKKDLFKKYENEICSRIDLINARSIMRFFQENNILDKFSLISILQITLYGRYEYIRDFYYEKVVSKDNKLRNIYFTDAMSCVWINEKSTTRRRNTTIKTSNERNKSSLLYSNIHEVCDDDVWENIRLLKENEDILHEKYDLANIDYLWVITKPTWLIKKNIELFRIFNISDVKLTALSQVDLEDKIHFVIELGLLNSPRNAIFRDIETRVPKYDQFILNGKKKRHINDNILNYYSRNTSEIAKPSYTEYIYWFYKMLRSGKEEFYHDFFSSYRAGTRNKIDFYSTEDLVTIKDKDALERIVDENFVINYYDALIPNYDMYDEVLREYNISPKGDVIVPYYDERILEDDSIKRLEEHVIADIYTKDGEYRKVNNPYVYVFDRNIISRYKVLRNLTILKNKYGYLNEDMILTSIVRSSYIDKNAFDLIENSVRNEGLVK